MVELARKNHFRAPQSIIVRLHCHRWMMMLMFPCQVDLAHCKRSITFTADSMCVCWRSASFLCSSEMVKTGLDEADEIFELTSFE